MKSIRSKLMIMVLITIVLISVVTGTITYNISSTIMKEEIEQKLLEQVQNETNAIGSDFLEFEMMEESLREYVQAYFDVNAANTRGDDYIKEFKDELSVYMGNIAKRYTGKLYGIYVTFNRVLPLPHQIKSMPSGIWTRKKMVNLQKLRGIQGLIKRGLMSLTPR